MQLKSNIQWTVATNWMPYSPKQAQKDRIHVRVSAILLFNSSHRCRPARGTCIRNWTIGEFYWLVDDDNYEKECFWSIETFGIANVLFEKHLRPWISSLHKSQLHRIQLQENAWSFYTESSGNTHFVAVELPLDVVLELATRRFDFDSKVVDIRLLAPMLARCCMAAAVEFYRCMILKWRKI